MSKSVLSKLISSKNIIDSDKDGETYINISLNGETSLGRMLHPKYSKKFTVEGLGDFYSMEAYMNFLTIKNYPTKLLSKPRITRREFESFGKPIRRTLGNYYSLVTLGLYNKINQDEELYNELINNKLEFASIYRKKINLKQVNSSVTYLNTPTPKMDRYISIIRYLSIQFKKYGRNITPTILTSIIDDTKDKPELELTNGLV